MSKNAGNVGSKIEIKPELSNARTEKEQQEKI